MSASGRSASERLKRIWGFGIATVLLLSVALSLVLNLGGPVAPMRVPEGPGAAGSDAIEGRGMVGLSNALAATAVAVLVLCVGLSLRVLAGEWRGGAGGSGYGRAADGFGIELRLDRDSGDVARTTVSAVPRTCEVCEAEVDSTIPVELTTEDGSARTKTMQVCDSCLERLASGAVEVRFE